MTELVSHPFDLLLFAALLMVGLWTGLFLARLRVRLRIASHRRRGARAEKRARRLLKAHGYKVEDTQITGHVHLRVDGERQQFHVRADFLVSRQGRRFIAECKGGSISGSVAHIPTRRQLLEYAHTFAVDGVLLVNTVADEVKQVEFLKP